MATQTTADHTTFVSDTGTASASTTYSTEYVWHLFNKETGSSSANRWLCASGQSAGAWIKYEFSEPAAVQTYRVFPPMNTSGAVNEARQMKTWDVQVSDNDVDWTNIAQEVDVPSSAVNDWGSLYTIAVPVEALYVRILIQENHGDAYVGAQEVEFVYEPSAVEPPPSFKFEWNDALPVSTIEWNDGLPVTTLYFNGNLA